MKPIVGRTRFNIEVLKGIPRPPFVTATNCVLCEETFIVERGAVHAVFRVGSDVVGIACDECLSPETRVNLSRVRERTKASR